MKICKNCGVSFEGNFCSNCGTMNEEEINQQPVNDTMKSKKEKSASKKKLGIIIGGMMVVICIVLVVVFMSKNSPFNQIKEAINNGDYEDAYELFLEKDMDSEDESELEDMLISEVEKLKNKYILEEMDYEGIISSMEKLKKFEMSEVDKSVDESIVFVEQLYNSRKNYELAIKFVESEDYKRAIGKFLLVWKNDPDYDTAMSEMSDAKEKYKEKVLNEAEEFVANEDYKKATEVLEDALEILVNDVDVEYKLTIYEEEKINMEVAAVLAEAEKYYDAKNYEKALSVLDEGITKYSSVYELVDKKAEYKEAILNMAISEAETSFGTGGHIAAINQLNKYTDIVGMEEDFMSKLDYYKSLEPDLLNDIPAFDYSGGGFVSVGDVKDRLGNQFVNALENHWDYWYSWAEYNLDRRYKTFSGRLGYSGESGNVKGVVQFFVYADGVEVYRSGDITAKTPPVVFEIDITNVSFLEIKYQCVVHDGSLILDQLYLSKY